MRRRKTKMDGRSHRVALVAEGQIQINIAINSRQLETRRPYESLHLQLSWQQTSSARNQTNLFKNIMSTLRFNHG